MKLSPAEKLRPTPWDAIVVVVVVACAIALILALRPTDSDQRTAQITLDGVVIAEYDLNSVEDPLLIPIDSPYPLTIEVDNGQIRIADSTCPGGDCLHSGWVTQAGGQIICLPNRLVISIIGNSDSEFDAILG